MDARNGLNSLETSGKHNSYEIVCFKKTQSLEIFFFSKRRPAAILDFQNDKF